jgi:hypothetical protein
MVELEDERVSLSAVDARMRPKERDEVGGSLRRDGPLSALRLVDVALAVGGVVLLLVCGAARTAVIVSLPECFPTPRELCERLEFSAASTSPHGLSRLAPRPNVCSS